MSTVRFWRIPATMHMAWLEMNMLLLSLLFTKKVFINVENHLLGFNNDIVPRN
jgi:hypothetical protein